jgi:putative FmdB family regulatory protein
MPMYNYYCETCDENFTFFHKIKEKKEYCEKCECKTLRKIPAPFFGNSNTENIERAKRLQQGLNEAKQEIHRTITQYKANRK